MSLSPQISPRSPDFKLRIVTEKLENIDITMGHDGRWADTPQLNYEEGMELNLPQNEQEADKTPVQQTQRAISASSGNSPSPSYDQDLRSKFSPDTPDGPFLEIEEETRYDFILRRFV